MTDSADCFRTTITALRSIEEGKGLSLYTYSVPDDRTAMFLMTNLGRKMPQSDVREELEVLGITVVSVLQLQWHLRATDTAKDRPLTPHFILTVPGGPMVSKVIALTSLCGLRTTVETYQASKCPLQYKNCQRFRHTQRNCVTLLGAWPAGGHTLLTATV